MTTSVLTYPLIEDLPVHMAPPWAFVNFHTLVPTLMDLYPDWDLEDVVAFVEEKTHQPVHGEAYDILLACYTRCACLRQEFEETST